MYRKTMGYLEKTAMKKLAVFFGVLLAALFLAARPASAATTTFTDFSEEYMSGEYYAKLMQVDLTGNYRQDLLSVARSQIGYCEGDSEEDLDGSVDGSLNFTEYGRYMGSNGSAWCSEFASWCARVAGIPTSILGSSKTASVTNFAAPYYTWSETIFAGGYYTPQPGDLALFAWTGTSTTASYLSHTAIISDVTRVGDTVKITVIHGNSGGEVKGDYVYSINASTGACSKGHLVYIVSPSYECGGNHTWVESSVITAATCTTDGEMLYTCTACHKTKTESIPATGHSYGAWTTLSAATVFANEIQIRTCTNPNCTTSETLRIANTKLKPTIKTNVSSIRLQVGQSTKGVVVSGLANGDSVVSWTSADKKIATVNKNGKIKGKKAGTTKITIKLASGKTKIIKVTVQASAVAATKLSVASSKIVLAKGSSTTLSPVVSPITCLQKITYHSSNTKVATVTSKGKIKALKKGTAKITIRCGTKSAVVTVRVKNTVETTAE
ncbi:MAG: Ig-like domain-containing protein [Lachnospiraceae bacterium]|nr:Ig-like domain-containing protein [Lachnospiraceae bacterium]